MGLYTFFKKDFLKLKGWQQKVVVLSTIFHIIMLVGIVVDSYALSTCCWAGPELRNMLVILHIFSVTNPLFVRIIPLQYFLLKGENKKIWEIETLSVYNTVTCAGLSTITFHVFKMVLEEKKTISCGCKFYPLILAAILTCFHIIVAIFLGVYFFIKISRNLYRVVKILTVWKVLDNKIRSTLSIEKFNKESTSTMNFIEFIDVFTRKGSISKQLIKNQEAFLKICTVNEDEPLNYLLFQEPKTEPHCPLILSLLQKKKRVALYKSKLTIPKSIFDPRAYALILVLSKFEAYILTSGLLTTVTNYYWNQIKHTQRAKKVYTWALSAITVLYCLHVQFNRYLAIEIGTLMLLLYCWSYEWIEMATNPNLNFYKFEHFIDILIRIFTIGHILAAWTVDGFRTEINLSSIIILLCCLKVGFTANIFEPLEKFFLFMNQLATDLAGLAVVLVLCVIAFAMAFSKILEAKVYVNNYSFSNALNYVAIRVTGGFAEIPADVGTVYPIVYFAIILLPTILFNSVIAVQSDTWVFIKENFQGVVNLDQIRLMASYLNTKRDLITEQSQDISFYWFGEPSSGDAECQEDSLNGKEIKRGDTSGSKFMGDSSPNTPSE